MSHNLSSQNTNHVLVDDVLKITLEEPASNNFKWELDVPSSFTTIKSSYEPTPSTLLRTWLLQPTAPGQFTVYCHYRKMCCGRHISQTVAYQIIVH